MERTQNQAWTELRDELEKFVRLQADATTPMNLMTSQRIKVERLERELADFERKAA